VGFLTILFTPFRLKIDGRDRFLAGFSFFIFIPLQTSIPLDDPALEEVFDVKKFHPFWTVKKLYTKTNPNQ